MSDTSQGPGWWQASDGKWYPPEQAPGYQPPVAGGGAPDGGGGTDLGTVLTYSWNKFVQNIGEWIVLWLVFIAIYVLFFILAFALAAGGAMGGFRFNFGGILIGVVQGIVTGVVLVIVAKGAVQATAGQKVDIAECFKLSGNNIVAGAIFGVVVGLLGAFCFPLGLIGFLFLGFVPVLSALDDKGADALGESVNLSTGHANEAMVFWLIGWFLASICGLGAPIAMIGGTYLVKRYRGEPVAA